MLTLLTLVTGLSQAAPQDYVFLANRGLLYVKVMKADTIAAAAAHNHAIQAVGWSGKATWNKEDYSACSLSIVVPVNNLYVDKTETRRVAGLEGEASDSQRQTITKNMLAEGQLNAEDHPLITFKSTSCTGEGEKATIVGEYTMRGVTRSISVPVSVTDDDGFRIKGSFSVKATDFGFEPYSTGFGAIANQDKMEVFLDLYSKTK